MGVSSSLRNSISVKSSRFSVSTCSTERLLAPQFPEAASASSAPPAADPAPDRARTRISFGTGPGAKALAGKPDYLLIGENGEVISEGYFDHNWQLPAEARQKLSICLP